MPESSAVSGLWTDLAPPDPLQASLYIHIPFCGAKCSYCDFYSVADAGSDVIRETIRQTVAQIRAGIDAFNIQSIPTVYIGGGTPSSLPHAALGELLESVAHCLPQPPGEWTCEANPESLTREFLRVLKQAGVTRLSVGMQTSVPRLLKVLDRKGSPAALPRAMDLVRETWTGSMNVDLITGIPSQTEREARADAGKALGFAPDHVSLYDLTFEPGTGLHNRRLAGEFGHMSSDRAHELWLGAAEALRSHGFLRYEVSNFSKPGKESAHNVGYWNLLPYLGAGPSAVSTLPHPAGGMLRISNPRSVESFLTGGKHAWGASRETVVPREALFETLIMGFRLVRGISDRLLVHRFGASLSGLLPGTTHRLLEENMIEKTAEGFALTMAGFEIQNSLLIRMLEEIDTIRTLEFHYP